MKTDGFINFLGFPFFTYSWLTSNLRFFSSIANLTNEHNEYIRCVRQKAIEEYMESEDESEDENEDE